VKSTVVLLLLAFGLAGQVVPGRYILELSGDPAAVSTAKQGVRFAARAAAFAARRAGVRQTQTAARAAVAVHGGTVIESMDTVVNGLIVNIPDARAAELLQVPGALKVHPVRKVKPLLNHALPLHKVPDAWSLIPLGENGAGAGVKIGMIDTGIDVNNPAFSDSLPALDGFPKVLVSTDQQFTNAKVIVAKNYTTLLPDGGDPDANDRDGHGTGTSLAAAGGPATTPYGLVTGVAPKAYLGNYKVLDANGGTSDVIAKAIDDAVADGMDVLNISLGAYVTSYSDIDSSEVGMAAIENATKAGVIVVVAAGNEGPGPSTIADYASAPDAITMGAIHNDRTLGYGITADGVASPYQAFAGDGPDPGRVISGTLFDVTALDATGLACSSLPAGSVTGRIVLVMRGTCTFAAKLNDVAAGGAQAIIVYNSAGGGSFSPSVGSATLPALFLSYADGVDLKARVAQNSAMQVAMDFTGATPFAARTDVSDFSSRGPSVGSALKPDLVAVGEEIVTGAQNSFPSGDSYSASGFIDTNGTSFSTPLAAGAAAVLKAARPGLTGQQYRSLLINSGTAATAAEGVDATVSQAGAGMLNLAAAVGGTVAAYPTSLNFGTGSGAVHNTLQLTLTNVSSSSDTYTVQVVPSGNSPAPAVAASVQLDPGASQQVPVTVDASGLGAGEYQGYLLVSGTVSQATARIPYWFAVPGNTPVGISVLYQDYYDSARSVSAQAVVLRVVDVAGLPYTGTVQPQISISGSGSVRAFYRTGTIPGTYAVDIRTGTSSMQLTFTIGTVSETVVIPVY
jgi:subtilisin family serine protease